MTGATMPGASPVYKRAACLTRVCFMGTTRVSAPLDATQRKKWAALGEGRRLYVVAYAPRARFSVERDGPCTFYLFPYVPTLALRAAGLLPFRVAVGFWLCLARGVRILVAQSPYEAVPCRLIKALAAAAGQRVKVIVESHGDFAESLFLQRRIALAPVTRWVMSSAARFGIRGADVLRAVSSTTEAQLKAVAPATPLRRFPAWTDIDVFFNAPAGKSPRPEMVFAGTLSPLKGVHYLLEAFAAVAARFPNAVLHLAGPAPDRAYAGDLRRQSAGLALQGKIRFHGPLDQTRLAGLFAASWFSVLPSLSEGLARVIIESMAAGTPVVASRVGGVPDLVRPGETGILVEPRNVVPLAEAMEWMIENPAEREAMGKRARESAAKIFSKDSYVRAYDGLFAVAGEAS